MQGHRRGHPPRLLRRRHAAPLRVDPRRFPAGAATKACAFSKTRSRTGGACTKVTSRPSGWPRSWSRRPASGACRLRIHRPARVAGSSSDGAANTGDLFYSLIKGMRPAGRGARARRADRPLSGRRAGAGDRRHFAAAPTKSARARRRPQGYSHHYYNDGTASFARADPLARPQRPADRAGALPPSGAAAWSAGGRRRRSATRSSRSSASIRRRPTKTASPASISRPPRQLLRGAGIAVPPADDKLLRIYWNFLLRSGFLNPSDGKALTSSLSREPSTCIGPGLGRSRGICS